MRIEETSGKALEIFKDRYAFHPDETPLEASLRVATMLSSAEKDVQRFKEEFFTIMADKLWCPGGRVLRGAGRPVPALLNCFVIPSMDSREGWAKMVGDNIIIAGTGGGLGENYGNIRPRGTIINGTGGVATGAVSIMRIENAALEEIRSGGGRRAARMMTLPINHPDIIEFLDAKLELNQLNNANVSVFFPDDPEEFFDKVRNNEDIDLTFKGTTYKSVSARLLWDKIVSHALKNGEPGMLNGYLANKMSTIAYAREIVSTNPCGEIPLQPYGNCCLGSIVLPNILKDSKSKDLKNRIDWELLHHVVTTSVRALDDVLTVSHYPIPELREESMLTRRVGLGIMGLHHMLLRLGVKYSSPEALDLCDKLGTFIKHAAYDASISLAIEKGPFPLEDPKKGRETGFIQSLKPSIRNKIRTYGLRNCALLNIPPTGTTAMYMNVSSGVEPIFSAGFLRRHFKGDVKTETLMVDPVFREMVR